MYKFFCVCIATFVLLSCENSESEIKALNTKNIQKDEAVKIESFLSQGGAVKARLTSPQMLRVMLQSPDTPYVEFPKTLHVDFYNEAKVVESRLDARYGKYFESLGKVYLRDSVIVVSIKGDTMLCEDVWWDQNTEKFHSDKKTIVKSKEIPYYVAKDGFEASQDLKTKTFFSGSGNVLTEDGAITAPGTEAVPATSPTPAPTTGKPSDTQL